MWLVVQGRSAPPWGRKMWTRHLALQTSGAFHRLWNTLDVCVSVNPGRPMVPVSLQVSLVVEGTALLSAGPWTVALSSAPRGAVCYEWRWETFVASPS